MASRSPQPMAPPLPTSPQPTGSPQLGSPARDFYRFGVDVCPICGQIEVHPRGPLGRRGRCASAPSWKTTASVEGHSVSLLPPPRPSFIVTRRARHHTAVMAAAASAQSHPKHSIEGWAELGVLPTPRPRFGVEYPAHRGVCSVVGAQLVRSASVGFSRATRDGACAQLSRMPLGALEAIRIIPRKGYEWTSRCVRPALSRQQAMIAHRPCTCWRAGAVWCRAVSA